MAAENPPMAIQADSHSAEVVRRSITSLLGGVTAGTPGGIVNVADLAVTAGSGNSLNVAPGEVWIPGNSQAHMGAYYGYNDGIVNLGVTPNGSNPLYAIVTASVNDQAYTGNPGVANNTWNLLLTQGTAAPSPTVPATPANSLLLATVLVPAAASSSAAYTITDNRVPVRITPSMTPGQILAYKRIITPTYAGATGAFACMDSTNAVLTITAPSSGKVLLQESTLWNVATSTEVLQLQWSNGTTNNTGLLGSPARTGALVNSQFLELEHVVTGLTPGTSYTLALQWCYTIAAGGSSAGGGVTDLVLKAIAL